MIGFLPLTLLPPECGNTGPARRRWFVLSLARGYTLLQHFREPGGLEGN